MSALGLPRTTVIGGSGFIGQHVVKELQRQGLPHWEPAREEPGLLTEQLGHVIYCAGVTSDFRQRPFDTMRAHVGFLGELLEKAAFDSFVYLSSTRIYLGSPAGEEDTGFVVHPKDPDHLFHLSKLAGEALCLQSGRSGVRIARISNVCGEDYGSGNFLYSLLADAAGGGEVELRTSLDSAKDYIGVEDVARLLIRISQDGKERIYNVASGVNTTNRSLVQWLKGVTGCQIRVRPGAPTVCFPPISIERIRNEFYFEPGDGEAMLRSLMQRYWDGKRN